MSSLFRRLRPVFVSTGTVLALAASAPAAHASLLNLPGTGCPDQSLEQPFSAWGDYASYVRVPGGTFEPGDAPWNTSGGPQIVGDNEPWQVAGDDGQQALSLPPGSSATSPAMCDSLASPTLRLFARSIGGSASSSLRIDAVFDGGDGLLDTLSVGTVTPTSDEWAPTPPYAVALNTLAPLAGTYRLVAFRFTPQGDATWEIDDVYQDPWGKG